MRYADMIKLKATWRWWPGITIRRFVLIGERTSVTYNRLFSPSQRLLVGIDFNGNISRKDLDAIALQFSS